MKKKKIGLWQNQFFIETVVKVKENCSRVFTEINVVGDERDRRFHHFLLSFDCLLNART